MRPSRFAGWIIAERVFPGQHSANAIMHNCYSDYAQTNAEDLIALLGNGSGA